MGKTFTVNAKQLRASTPSFRFYIADGSAPVPHGFYLEVRFQTDAGTEVMATYALESTSDGGVTFTSVDAKDHTGAVVILAQAQVSTIKSALANVLTSVVTDMGY